jgi:hypothetical protein
MGEFELLVNMKDVDRFVWLFKTGAYLVVWSMSLKTCMGMVIVGMVLALYLKIDIIYN